MLSLDFVPWSAAPADRYPRLSHYEPGTACLDNRLVWGHEAAGVILTKAGPGQAFLVARTGWGADAASQVAVTCDRLQGRWLCLHGSSNYQPKPGMRILG